MEYVAIKNELSEEDYESLTEHKNALEIIEFSVDNPQLKVFMPCDLACAVSSRLKSLSEASPTKNKFSFAEVINQTSDAFIDNTCCNTAHGCMQGFAKWVYGFNCQRSDKSMICIDHWSFGGSIDSPRYQNAIMHYFFQNMPGAICPTQDPSQLLTKLTGCINAAVLEEYWKGVTGLAMEFDYRKTDWKGYEMLHFLLDVYAWIGIVDFFDNCQVHTVIREGGALACCLAGIMSKIGHRDEEKRPWNRKNWHKYLVDEGMQSGKRKRTSGESDED